MIPVGSVLGSELSNIHPPKYSVRNHRASILYKCPHCNGFHLLERTGQILTDDMGISGIYWEAMIGRWFTCGDCNKGIYLEDAVRRNRRKLDDVEKTALMRAVIAQDSRAKIYDVLKRNNAAMNPASELLVELYAQWLPDDPIATNCHGEL
ncbi:hypothetical protein [Vibrio phage vB_pir03]|nr:hypothetical protein [Vibrio phage vB_pir03]